MTSDRSVRLPVHLGRLPLVEAVVEIRFTPAHEAAGDLLPGLLYSKLNADFPKSESLPLGSIPKELRQLHPELGYQARFKLVGEQQSILVADRAVTVSKTPPYTGWTAFRALASRVFAEVHATGLVGQLQRVSFRCINLLELKDRAPFQLLNGEFRLADYAIQARGLHTRCEIDTKDHTSIIEITVPAQVQLADGRREGLMLSIDTINSGPNDEFWRDVPTHLDAIHAVLKTMFFGIVRSDVVNEYEPEWGRA